MVAVILSSENPFNQSFELHLTGVSIIVGLCPLRVYQFFLPRLSFLTCGDFHARSRCACSTIPEEKWGLLVV